MNQSYMNIQKTIAIILFLVFTISLSVVAQKINIPAARSGYAMAYDAGRGVVVLFGGQDQANNRLDDTWEWSNGVWKQIAVKGPSARMNAPMAYDAEKKRVVVFGGRSEAGTENDLWAYDGKSWSKINTSVSPDSRQLAIMAFDKLGSQLVLFGGMDSNKNAIGDTWILKNDQWKELKDPGPSPRSSACMAYNDGVGAVFIYGGYVNGKGVNEFWELKDGNWHDMGNQGGPGRIHASISYDQKKDRMLLFGGFDDQGRTNELWQYDNGQWTQIPTGSGLTPDTRAEHRSVFIPGKGLFVFGGVIGPDPNTRNRGNDTWLFDGTTWAKI